MQERSPRGRFTDEIMRGSISFITEACIINVSKGGIALETKRKIDTGREYTVHFEKDDKTFPIKCCTVWSLKIGTKKDPIDDAIPIYHVGMKFSRIDDDKIDELAEFIENYNKSHGRRLFVRVNVRPGEKVTLNCPIRYTVRQITLSGMVVRTAQELQVEDCFPMEIYLTEGAPTRFCGKIIACSANGSKGPTNYDVGIHFLEISESDRAMIELRSSPGTLSDTPRVSRHDTL